MEFDGTDFSDGLRGRKAIQSDSNDGMTLLALGVLGLPCTLGLSFLPWIFWYISQKMKGR